MAHDGTPSATLRLSPPRMSTVGMHVPCMITSLGRLCHKPADSTAFPVMLNLTHLGCSSSPLFHKPRLLEASTCSGRRLLQTLCRYVHRAQIKVVCIHPVNIYDVDYVAQNR